ncbi:hypothetical protein K505DRAFT_229016 [Melanomma pulvis-pyrius CBS 109.77]|uniref:Uncharacterized protein n=1 Tax=Melanomma pulvis-pyrius CBS 109.77 TaxID=1314802 RepID=A0A6A6XVE1_9PLEO|nr:hypothetical protein K505DRAFT_229016 [Melanomma pulvis-pyrius CBS 109.77]
MKVNCKIKQSAAKQKHIQKTQSRKKEQHSPSLPSTGATWKDVLYEGKTAKEGWERRAKGNKTLIRYVSERASLVNHWMSLLPGGDYGSIVCGVLKMVFGALAANSVARSSITDCLEDLPTQIEEANQLLQIYYDCNQIEPTDRLRLQSAAMDLSGNILEIVNEIISFLNRRSWSESELLPFPSPSSSRETNYNSLRRSASALSSCRKNFPEVSRTLLRKYAGLHRIFKRHYRTIPQSSNSTDRDSGFPRLVPSRSCTPFPPAPFYLSHESIAQFLSVNPSALSDAIHRSLSNGPGDSRSSASVIQYLARETRLSNWLRSNEPGSIVLDRNTENSFQIFSYFAAILVSSLKSYQEAIPVHYFGATWNEDNLAPGRYHFIRSLIFQLLPFTNDLNVPPQALHGPAHLPSELQALFTRCLSAIPAGRVVFFIMDGVSQHAEDNEDEVKSVIQTLESAAQAHPYVKIKVLLTLPVGFEIIQNLPEDSMNMLPSDELELSDVVEFDMSSMMSG